MRKHNINTRKTRCFIFDARGNGNGEICNTITGDHQNRITDYTAIVLEVYDDDTNSEVHRERTGESANW